MAGHVCPWWLCWHVDNPLRGWLQHPEAMFKPYVRPGMVSLDVGCGSGFFTRPLARLVGPTGTVVAVDVQQRMLDMLRRRAARQGLAERIETRLCRPDDLGLGDRDHAFDFALTFAMVHEVPDPAGLFSQLAWALKPDGTLYVGEPSGRVSVKAFERTIEIVEAAGFKLTARPEVWRSRTAVFMNSADAESRRDAVRA
jgi:ubiquinone/menaquinone biosynthesis C-methylase UbiE